MLVETSEILFLCVCSQHFNLGKVLEPFMVIILVKVSLCILEIYALLFLEITSHYLTDEFLPFETPVKLLLASSDPLEKSSMFYPQIIQLLLNEEKMCITTTYSSCCFGVAFGGIKRDMSFFCL